MNTDEFIKRIEQMPTTPCPLHLRQEALDALDEREQDCLRIIEAIRKARQKFKTMHGIV